VNVPCPLEAEGAALFKDGFGSDTERGFVGDSLLSDATEGLPASQSSSLTDSFLAGLSAVAGECPGPYMFVPTSIVGARDACVLGFFGRLLSWFCATYLRKALPVIATPSSVIIRAIESHVYPFLVRPWIFGMSFRINAVVE
jgi:hypothetical protein